MLMLHPVNRSSTRCTTSMASLLLSFRSSQEGRIVLYSGVSATDHYLVETTIHIRQRCEQPYFSQFLWQHLPPPPLGILCRVLPADFVQEEEATNSLPLMLKCSTRQPLCGSKTQVTGNRVTGNESRVAGQRQGVIGNWYMYFNK